MKKQHSTRSFLLGVLTTLVVLGLSKPALAIATQMIEVSTGVRIFIDDVELHPTDAGGNPVEPFIYNGTTYLPVRAVSEGLGKVVQWDGSTRSVYIGKHSSSVPAAHLNEMDYFTKDGSWNFDKVTKDNLGGDHLHSINSSSGSFSGYITYKLNGMYSRLTGSFYQEYEYRDSNCSGALLVISGDGVELWRGSVGPGIDPLYIDIDITGVLELKFEYPSGSGTRASNTALGDVALWS